jgi:hypothetical protein
MKIINLDLIKSLANSGTSWIRSRTKIDVKVPRRNAIGGYASDILYDYLDIPTISTPYPYPVGYTSNKPVKKVNSNANIYTVNVNSYTIGTGWGSTSSTSATLTPTCTTNAYYAPVSITGYCQHAGYTSTLGN